MRRRHLVALHQLNPSVGQAQDRLVALSSHLTRIAQVVRPVPQRRYSDPYSQAGRQRPEESGIDRLAVQVSSNGWHRPTARAVFAMRSTGVTATVDSNGVAPSRPSVDSCAAGEQSSGTASTGLDDVAEQWKYQEPCPRWRSRGHDCLSLRRSLSRHPHRLDAGSMDGWRSRMASVHCGLPVRGPGQGDGPTKAVTQRDGAPMVLGCSAPDMHRADRTSMSTG
jgi:hypothetical protein